MIARQRIQNNYLKEAEWAIREYRQVNKIKKMIYEPNDNIIKKIETIQRTKQNSGSEEYNNSLKKITLVGENFSYSKKYIFKNKDG